MVVPGRIVVDEQESRRPDRTSTLAPGPLKLIAARFVEIVAVTVVATVQDDGKT